MTTEQLDKANDLFSEISKLKRTIGFVQSSLDRYQNSQQTKSNKKFMLRFGNYFKSYSDSVESKKSAGIFLFGDDRNYSEDIMVGVEMVEAILAFLKQELENKQEEFSSIGEDKK